MSDRGVGRKRIAVLCAQPEEEYQKALLEGINRKFFASGFDVCVFAMYQKFQETKFREVGESNIYNLINFDLFEGVIILADTIQTPGVLRRLEIRLFNEYRGKVLFVDKESDYFPYISLPHYDGICSVVEHLITVHGFSDIAFVAGKKWHPHSKERLDAFKDTMARHGLSVPSSRIFYGDFWYSGGETIGDELMKSPSGLPEAIACANDYMAIGLASSLSKHGISIPSDIAIVGYDSAEDGRTSPAPITSVPLPSFSFGSYCADCLLALLDGRSFEPFSSSVSLFVGSSCGCQCRSVVSRPLVRDTWDTDPDTRSFMPDRNTILADMLSGADLEEVMETVRSYVYKIRDFERFDLCLNSFWVDESVSYEGSFLSVGYTDRMADVLSCDDQGRDHLEFMETFDILDILPDMDSPSPRCYIFTPMHFDDRCFGYAALGLGESIARFDHSYCMWLQNLMFGFEALRRLRILNRANKTMEANRFIDRMTGLYNYDGLLKYSEPLIDRSLQLHCYVSVMALDIDRLGEFNEAYGRKAGDRAIVKVAEIIKSASGENAVCCRLGNDEFVAAWLSDDDHASRIFEVHQKINDLLDQYNSRLGLDLKISTGDKSLRIGSTNEFENLINGAVTIKNANKIREQRLNFDSSLTPEQKKTAETVKMLLDENRFRYHYQPIVSARTGEIFAFEALMRPDIDPYIGPAVVIEYAEHLGRIYDVEKSTFLNVLREFERNIDRFNDRKLFINCITGVTWTQEDTDIVAEKLRRYNKNIVLELTEQREADDQMLAKMKDQIRKLGIQSALDDYGTGYSNVVNLLRYMPDYVKIDRMLLAGIESNPQKQHFVRDVAQFAHDNNFSVLAEGVETKEEMRTCIEIGADFLQGYYLGRPEAEIITAIDPKVRMEILEFNRLI
ncbi:diguanylate cyclase (GGDEF) domain-containing protein [Oscillospiraceae bacterium]|nr:diguanylate cyclase (GGDEF) domain-containing protein [Oscillospiraceae bacterium]